jgi:hypothetical protein
VDKKAVGIRRAEIEDVNNGYPIKDLSIEAHIRRCHATVLAGGHDEFKP